MLPSDCVVVLGMFYGWPPVEALAEEFGAGSEPTAERKSLMEMKAWQRQRLSAASDTHAAKPPAATGPPFHSLFDARSLLLLFK